MTQRMPRSSASTRACGLISCAASTPWREQRISVQQLEVAGQLLHSVNLATALDLDGDAPAVRVAVEQVNRPNGGGVLAPDKPPALAQRFGRGGEQFLQMCLHTVLDQPRIHPELVRGVVQDLLDTDPQFLTGLDDSPSTGVLFEPAWRGHPVQRLV